MVEKFEWKWSIPKCRRVVCEIRGVTAWPKDIDCQKPEQELRNLKKKNCPSGHEINQVYRRTAQV